MVQASDIVAYEFCSGYKGKDCWQCGVTSGSVLEDMRSSDWLPFLTFVTLMKEDYRMKKVYTELFDLAGVSHQAVDRWKVKYHSALLKFVEEVDKMVVGGKHGRNREVVAVDESAPQARTIQKSTNRSTSRTNPVEPDRIRRTLC